MRPERSPSNRPPEGELVIGHQRIRYTVRESGKVKHRRIVVEPGTVEVVVPPGTPDQGPGSAAELVEQKRRWIYEKTAALIPPATSGQRYLSGATIRFRGRGIGLRVEEAEVDRSVVTYRSRFHVRVPRGLEPEQKEALVGSAVQAWLNRRLLADGTTLARRFARMLVADLGGVRLLPMTRMWASCGKDRVIRLVPELIRLPRPVLEYVLAHETAHLVHRNHSPAFWRTVAILLPEWEERRDWLRRHEADREL